MVLYYYYARPPKEKTAFSRFLGIFSRFGVVSATVTGRGACRSPRLPLATLSAPRRPPLLATPPTPFGRGSPAESLGGQGWFWVLKQKNPGLLAGVFACASGLNPFSFRAEFLRDLPGRNVYFSAS